MEREGAVDGPEEVRGFGFQTTWGGICLRRKDLSSLMTKRNKRKGVCNRSVLFFNCNKALNEVDDDEQEGTVNSQSEESENELDNSLSSQSNANAGT